MIRRPFVPQNIQYGGGRRNMELGDSGGANRGGNRGTQVDYPGVGGFFYLDDGMVVLPRTERLQRLLNVLTNILDRVGPLTNMQTTVSMDCQTCYTSGGFS